MNGQLLETILDAPNANGISVEIPISETPIVYNPATGETYHAGYTPTANNNTTTNGLSDLFNNPIIFYGGLALAAFLIYSLVTKK